MLLRRDNLEEIERDSLMRYAQKSADSRGRECEERRSEFRNCYQRDIDRLAFLLSSAALFAVLASSSILELDRLIR